jgi:hypothetical protein
MYGKISLVLPFLFYEETSLDDESDGIPTEDNIFLITIHA